MKRALFILIAAACGLAAVVRMANGDDPAPDKARPSAAEITLARKDNMLIIGAPQVPGREIQINYLEAYCRAGSTDADWVKHTVVGHKTESLADTGNGKQIRLRCTVNDGLIVDHDIRAVSDGVTFDLTVTNPTNHPNEAQWAQPCIRLGDFSGAQTSEPNCPDIRLDRAFVFLGGKLTTMPTKPWATQARYTPGQVWCPKDVPRTDVNPRPLSTRCPTTTSSAVSAATGNGSSRSPSSPLRNSSRA